jgi:uncharacterized membrane protein required for colicin V production
MAALGGVTAYDGVMALIVIFATFHGYWKGATWQIAPIMSLVLGYMIAMPMSVTTAHYFGNPPQNRLFALVTIYIGVSLVVYFLVRSFREGIEKAKLTEFDRHLGALLGALKGILLTLAITVILLIYSTMARDLILKSESSSIAAKIINAVYPILPKAMHQILSPYLKQLNRELPLNLNYNDDDGQINNTILPEKRSPLTPTNTNARRTSFDQFAPDPRRSLISDDEGDDQGYPAAQPPRRLSVPADNVDTRVNRRKDSASRVEPRYPVDDQPDYRDPPRPSRRALVPIPDEEDDPFVPSNPNRYTQPMPR